MRVIQPRLNGVISISNFLYEYYTIKHTKTILIPPLVDANELKWRKRDSENKDILHFIYAGSPFSLKSKESPKDRLDSILKVFEIFKTEGRLFKLSIVGINSDDLLYALPELDNTLNILAESVIFHGILPHVKTIKLLCESDFSIFIRDKSLVTSAGFPTKFVESITCGIPVLTNQSSNISDFLVEGKNGFWIDNSNQDSIYRTLQQAFMITHEQLTAMKVFCFESKLFDYRKYLNSFQSFLD
jgi:glycosyltransferase involved in cell wall biosynthesis